MKDFIRERNEALFSLDEKKIRAYLAKYGMQMPKNRDVFWGGIYKAVLQISDAPPELRAKAREWLDAKGWDHDIG